MVVAIDIKTVDDIEPGTEAAERQLIHLQRPSRVKANCGLDKERSALLQL
jgi:hypothetical protein